MDLTLARCFVGVHDPDASLAASIVLEPPAADPGVTDDERRTITEMMAKGNFRASVRL